MHHPNVVHWDDVPAAERRAGHMAGRWRDLARAAGAIRAGVLLGELEPHAASSPAHVHADEEELFYVLEGSGFSWQDGRTYAVGAGDVLLHRVREAAHTLIAGDAGLTYLVFGPRAIQNLTWLPRAGVMWVGPRWLPADVEHPYVAEAAAGPPQLTPPEPRPATIAALEDVPPSETHRGTVRRKVRGIGDALGAEATGMRHVRVAPGGRSSLHHCHSAEEELFVVLGGAGAVRLGDDRFDVRRGSVVARPAGSGVAHSFEAGEAGLELLGWSLDDPNDMIHYPDSGTIFLRGLGVVGRLEPADYWEGEEEPG
ncbi:MAG TPA: cupin domain-containing protein [Baekduia sp.]|nr:cupin domain-containing protein [Baekduia sp.]